MNASCLQGSGGHLFPQDGRRRFEPALRVRANGGVRSPPRVRGRDGTGLQPIGRRKQLAHPLGGDSNVSPTLRAGRKGLGELTLQAQAGHPEGANPSGASEASQPLGQLREDARLSVNAGANPRCNDSTKRQGSRRSSSPKFSSASDESTDPGSLVPPQRSRMREEPTGPLTKATGLCKPDAPGEGDEKLATALQQAEIDR